eukprot:UN03712
MKQQLLFVVFMSVIIITNSCQVQCDEGATSCCIRGGCGCLKTLGTIAGCDGQCAYKPNDCPSPTECPLKCNSKSIACCEVKFCGCIDLDDLLNSKYGVESDCIRSCECNSDIKP